jgi:short-subunit dehydrogenase
MATSTRARALVTGASVGIGRAFAIELARRGHDLVLVARNAAQLSDLASDLSGRHSIDAEVLPADLLSPDGVAAVAARLVGETPIEVLVNNAGRGAHEAFATAALEDHLQQIDLNVRALVQLTHAALGPMTERGSGAVLNVASVAGFQPVPLESVYAATKAFVLTFTEGLHEELRGSGIKVSCLCPGFTRSEFQQRAGIDAAQKLPDFLWQTADEVAKAGLDALFAGKALCVPGTHNKVLGGLTHFAPRSVVRASSGLMLRRMG